MKDYSDKELKKYADILKNGGIGIFPTDTVYGIGTNGLRSDAVKRLYEIKKRNLKNPINLLVDDIKMIEEITQDISPLEYKLIKTFLPGPLTIILKKKNIVPNIVTAGSEFVGIRIPDNTVTRKLIDLSGVPIAAPSANISGKLSGTNLIDVLSDFSNNIDFAINGEENNIGIESTIVRVIDEVPHILRPGFITPEQIKEIAENVIIENTKNSILPSSNMKHYEIDSKAILVYSENNDKMVTKIRELSTQYKNPIILCCNENSHLYSHKIITISSKNNLIEYSKNIFSTLRKASLLSPDCIIIEGVKQQGLGIAIMDRLLNVCNNNYIEL